MGMGVIAGVAFGAVSASAFGPYQTGTVGYDVSYPNCGATASGTFAIVGVNGGRPFSNNSCFQAEYAAAPQSPAPSLYMNTGYSGAYRRNITANCSSQSTHVAGTSAQRQAWAIGCSEAETSLGVFNRVDVVDHHWRELVADQRRGRLGGGRVVFNSQRIHAGHHGLAGPDHERQHRLRHGLLIPA